MRLCSTVLLAFALVAAPPAVRAHDTVYFSHHVIAAQSPDDPRSEAAGFHRVSVQAVAKGAQQVTVRTLWAQEGVLGLRKQALSDLDPGDATQKQLLDAMAGGFQATVSAKGDVSALRQVNPQAWKAVAEALPEVAENGLSGEQVLGMFPMVLPAGLSVGQAFARTEQSRAYGELSLRMQVVRLTPEAAIVAVSLRGKGIRGAGRQAIQRSNGVPIEMRMTLQRDASGPVPATRHRMHVSDMAYEPMLDVHIDEAGYADFLSSVRTQLAQPPYSAISTEPGVYTLPDTGVGELTDWMVGEDALEAYEKGMRFAFLPTSTALRPVLHLGIEGRLSPRPISTEGIEPILTVRPRAVALLDRDGRVIEGLASQRVMRHMLLQARYEASESDATFPFRLPLTATREDTARIRAIRMTVDAEVYRWDGVEEVAVNATSTRNPGARVTSTAPHRLTLLQAKERPGTPDGVWTVAVPLDAQGKEIPFAELSVGPYQQLIGAEGEAEPVLPLEWDYRNLPYRMEIAAAAPIASVQLRHYRWSNKAREWEFWRTGRDGRPVL